MMYPEVHTLAGANLRWSGVEAQGTPNSTEAHCNLLDPSHQDGRSDHYGTLEGGHRTRTKIRAISSSPQLNWRLPRNWRVSQHSKSKKFLRMRTRKPRSNLGDVINKRNRWDLHTLEEIAQRKCSTKRGWCSRTSHLLLAIRSDPTPQVATPLRDAHVRCSDVSSFLGPASMVER
jgi:hypothetical protein